MSDILTIQVSDTRLAHASALFTIPILNPVDITTGVNLPQATQGVAYSTPLAFVGTAPFTPQVIGQGGSNTWSFSGANLVGTPATVETDLPIVLLLDALGIPNSKRFSLQVVAAAGGTLIVTANGGLPVPPGAQGIPYELIVNCNNGSGALVWNKISGPAYGSVANGIAGLAATQALFSGTPTGITAGDTFVIGVTDGASNTGQITFVL